MGACSHPWHELDQITQEAEPYFGECPVHTVHQQIDALSSAVVLAQRELATARVQLAARPAVDARDFGPLQAPGTTVLDGPDTQRAHRLLDVVEQLQTDAAEVSYVGRRLLLSEATERVIAMRSMLGEEDLPF